MEDRLLTNGFVVHIHSLDGKMWNFGGLLMMHRFIGLDLLLQWQKRFEPQLSHTLNATHIIQCEGERSTQIKTLNGSFHLNIDVGTKAFKTSSSILHLPHLVELIFSRIALQRYSTIEREVDGVKSTTTKRKTAVTMCSVQIKK